MSRPRLVIPTPSHTTHGVSLRTVCPPCDRQPSRSLCPPISSRSYDELRVLYLHVVEPLARVVASSAFAPHSSLCCYFYCQCTSRAILLHYALPNPPSPSPTALSASFFDAIDGAALLSCARAVSTLVSKASAVPVHGYAVLDAGERCRSSAPLTLWTRWPLRAKAPAHTPGLAPSSTSNQPVTESDLIECSVYAARKDGTEQKLPSCAA